MLHWNTEKVFKETDGCVWFQYFGNSKNLFIYLKRFSGSCSDRLMCTLTSLCALNRLIGLLSTKSRFTLFHFMYHILPLVCYFVSRQHRPVGGDSYSVWGTESRLVSPTYNLPSHFYDSCSVVFLDLGRGFSNNPQHSQPQCASVQKKQQAYMTSKLDIIFVILNYFIVAVS